MTGIAIPNFVMAPLLSLVFDLPVALPTSGWGTASGDTKSCRLSRSPCRKSPISRWPDPRVDGRGASFQLYPHRARQGASRDACRQSPRDQGALLPVVSYLGPATAAVTTGSVVIESIFAVPGIGSYFVDAALNRDYPLVMGVVIVYAVMIVLLNFLVRHGLRLLDPGCGRADDREYKTTAMLEAADDTADVEGRGLWRDARARLFRQQGRRRLDDRSWRHCPDGRFRSAAQPLRLRPNRLGTYPGRTRLGQRPRPRNRRERAGHVRPHPVRRACFACRRVAGDRGFAGDRSYLRRGLRLFRRQGRHHHDAICRCALFPALHVLRHHVDGGVRPKHLPDLRRAGRGRMADHGAHRARSNLVDPAARIHRGGPRHRRFKRQDHFPPRDPERSGAGDRLHDVDHPAGDSDEKSFYPSDLACRNR